FYFALGPLVPRVDGAPLLGSFGWAVVSLTLLETAFAAEIYRSGIEAVPKAMVEAAASLGYSRWQVYRLTMLPLALRATMRAIDRSSGAVVLSSRAAVALAAAFVASIVVAQIRAVQGQPSVVELLGKWTPLLAEGFLFNLLISFFAMLVGTVAGVLLGFARIS